jgi:hypothetical protein
MLQVADELFRQQTFFVTADTTKKGGRNLPPFFDQ